MSLLFLSASPPVPLHLIKQVGPPMLSVYLQFSGERGVVKGPMLVSSPRLVL